MCILCFITLCIEPYCPLCVYWVLPSVQCTMCMAISIHPHSRLNNYITNSNASIYILLTVRTKNDISCGNNHIIRNDHKNHIFIWKHEMTHYNRLLAIIFGNNLQPAHFSVHHVPSTEMEEFRVICIFQILG